MVKIGSIRRDAKLPCFVTLTYPDEFPDPAKSKRDLKIFVQRLKRRYAAAGAMWKLEPQERGAPHYHLLVWGVELCELREWVPQAWYEVAGGDDYRHYLFHVGAFDNQHCVQQVRSFRGVWSYASKYLGKTFDVAGWENKWTGRFWGVINPDNIPFGELVQVDASASKVQEIIRYARRFAGLPGRDYKSLTVFCDADQWARRLLDQGSPGAPVRPDPG